MLSDSESEDPVQLTINEHYANAFQVRKEREELEKLKAKYGSDAASDDDISTDTESAESEDEDGEDLTPVVDAAILRTLARIKKKDPEIYNEEKNIFQDEERKVIVTAPGANSRKPKDKTKPVYLRQVALDAILHPSRSPSPAPVPHVEEQRALRNETIAAFQQAVDNDDGDEGLLVLREKAQDEVEMEEEEYHAFLAREVGDLREIVTIGDDAAKSKKETEEEEKPKKGKGKKHKEQKNGERDAEKSVERGNTDKDQEFLLQYIMNRGWIDRSSAHVPTYKEVVSKEQSKLKTKSKKASTSRASSSGSDGKLLDEADTFSDASFESLASIFETSYNHRFEEPGAANISSFPRILPSTVRRPDTKRKDARERHKQHKEDELNKRKVEVRHMKALKMRQMRRRLEMIGINSGLTKDGGMVDEALQELDLDGDWDPEKHDRQMANLFESHEEVEGQDFAAWGGETGEDELLELDANDKPVWNDDIDIGDIPISDDDAMAIERVSDIKQKKKKKKKKNAKLDDGGVDVDAMDADALPLDEAEEWDGTEDMRKRKLDEYMNEIYALDFNDLVGDLPTRFNYVPVKPETYALTPVEILMANDQELNEYLSVKKYAPYKEAGSVRKWDGHRHERLREFKARLAARIDKADLEVSRKNPGTNDTIVKTKKRIGRKERLKLREEAAGAGDGGATAEATPQTPSENKLAGKMNSSKRKHEDGETASFHGEAKEQEQSKKKKKRKLKSMED